MDVRPPSSSCDGRLIVCGVALRFGGAELASVGNCSSPVVFVGRPFGQCVSCRHCFVAVDVGHPCVDSPVILWSSSRCSVAMLRFTLVVRSSRLWATTFPVVVGPAWVSPLSFRVVRPLPSSFRGSFRLGELGVAVLCRVEYSCRVVAGLAILFKWTFVSTFPPWNTFSAGPHPVFFRLWLSLYLL